MSTPSNTSERDQDRRLSRRELLKRVGMVGAVAAASGSLAPGATAAPGESLPTPSAQHVAPGRESLEALTATEADTLGAIVVRLIPTDENGPGGAEAHAARYIDRALAGTLATSRVAYTAGLSAVDSYAQTSKGAPFRFLSAKDQDAVLRDMEHNRAEGFTPDSSTFFNLVRTHAIQGTFSDPYYGGNVNFVGWDLIGYPGVRISVSADEQRMGFTLTPNHSSAYDYPMFSKKT